MNQTGTKKATGGAQKITPSEFDMKRLNFNRKIVEKKQVVEPGKKLEVSRQWTIFPKYVFGTSASGNNNTKVSEGDVLTILTQPIVFKRGGIPKFNLDYMKTKGETATFWIPLDEEFGGPGGVDFRKMCDSIDKHFGDEIKKNPSAFLTVASGDKAEEPIENLKYSALVKKSPKPANVDKKDYKPWYRCRVRIPFKEEKGEDPVISVKLALPNAETGKVDLSVATSLDELTKHFTYGCTAQFVLEMKTFWVLKATKDAEEWHECGFKLTCNMIRIVEESKQFKSSEHNWEDFIGGEGENAETEQKVAPKQTNEDSSDAGSDSDSDAPPPTKNAKQDSSDSDSDADTPEPPKPEPPKTAKAKTTKTK